MSGTWTAIGGTTNKIAWQKNVPFRVGTGGGSTTTASGLVLHGDPGGEIQARDAKSGELLWAFQTGFGAEATPMVYEVDGDEYIAIAAGGNQGNGSANGDAVWTFSLKGQLNPLWPPPPPPTVAGPASGPIADNASLDFSNAADIYSVNEAVSGCFQHAKAATRAYGGIFHLSRAMRVRRLCLSRHAGGRRHVSWLGRRCPGCLTWAAPTQS